jgi:tetratricopeptide (TPR) repeat protein
MYEQKLYNKAKTYKLDKKYELAIENYKKVLEIDRCNIDSLKELGEVYENIKDIDSAISCYEKIMDIEISNPNKQTTMICLNQIGVCNFNKFNYTEAVKYFRKVLELNRRLTDVYNNIANCYFKLRQYRNAEINNLISLKLKHDTRLYEELALIYFCTKEYDKSIEFYMKIENILEIPIKAYKLCFPYLAHKKFDIGFGLYENRLKNNEINHQTGMKERVDIPIVPFWNGSDECDNLLVCYEQGIGDNFQYYRFLIQLSILYPNMKISYFCKDSVSHIFKECYNIHIIKEIKNLLLYNYKCYIMSLPYFLKIDKIIPNTENYINVDSDKVVYWKNQIEMKNPEKKLNVGFCCKGLLSSYLEKQIPLLDFELLAELNIHLICLHKLSETNEELNSLHFKDKITTFDLDKDAAFVDTIAILKNIDILLTVDTSIVHLAGILDVKTILMLGYTSDWRWFSNNEKVWYNSVEFLRANENIELKFVLPEVKNIINNMIKLHRLKEK